MSGQAETEQQKRERIMWKKSEKVSNIPAPPHMRGKPASPPVRSSPFASASAANLTLPSFDPSKPRRKKSPRPSKDFVDLTADSESERKDNEEKEEKKAKKTKRTKNKVKPVCNVVPITLQDAKPFFKQNLVIKGYDKARDYQKKAFDAFQKKRVFSMLHGMGAGKTFTAALCAESYLMQNKTKKVVFMSPKTLLSNFYQELIKFGRTPEYIDKFYCFRSLESVDTSWSSLQNKVDGNLLIIDEFHEVLTQIKVKPKEKPSHKDIPWISRKNPRYSNTYVTSGKRAAGVLLAANKAEKVLLMTGTMIKNHYSDLQNWAMIYDQSVGPDSEFWKYFRSTNNDRYQTPKSSIIESIRKLMFCAVSYVPQNSPLLLELMPSYDETYHLIEMPKLYEREYKLVEGELNQKDDEDLEFEPIEQFRERGKFDVNLRQVASDMKGGLNPKINDVIWTIFKSKDQYPNLYPAVIATGWVERGVLSLQEAFRGKKLRVAVMYGQQKQSERDKTKEEYNQGKLDVLILSKVGSRGLDLKGTRTLVNINMAWNDAQRQQTMYRAIRVKSHEHLPEKERHVAVHQLLLVKKDESMALKEEIKKENPRVKIMIHSTELVDDEVDDEDENEKNQDRQELSSNNSMFGYQQIKRKRTTYVYEEIVEKVAIEQNKCLGSSKKKSSSSSFSSSSSSSPRKSPEPRKSHHKK